MRKRSGAMSEYIQSGQVTIACPTCGASDQDVDLDGEDINGGTLTVECEECYAEVDLTVTIDMEAKEYTDE